MALTLYGGIQGELLEGGGGRGQSLLLPGTLVACRLSSRRPTFRRTCRGGGRTHALVKELGRVRVLAYAELRNGGGGDLGDGARHRQWKRRL